MRNPPMFHLAWQRQSQLDARSVHSLLISLLRGLAALQVVAAHLRAEIFPGMRELGNAPLIYQLLAFATGFAHQAVVVFFLISGWLVGGSLLNKMGARAPVPLQGYAIDRLTRLWTVLIPALALMLAIGAITGAVEPAQPDASAANPWSAAAFAGNLAGLQTVLVENYGGNYALWSLANETWYYVAFPLLLLAFAPGSGLRQAAAATALLLLGGALPFPITLYFTLWLLGALFSRVRIDCHRGVRIGLAALAMLASLYFRIRGSNDDLNESSFVQDMLIGLPVVAMLSSLQMPAKIGSPARQRLARTAHWLSEFSFTLYVTHVPVIRLLRYLGLQFFGRSRLDPFAPLDYAVYAALLGALMLTAYGSYLLFESQTFRMRRIVKGVLQRRSRERTPA